MNPLESFKIEKAEQIKKMGQENNYRELGLDFIMQTADVKYSYHFNWLGLPIIQYPQDIVAMQEIVWRVQPDLIIETGIAHGGSLVFYASMLELIGNNGLVVGIDLDIRPHNRSEIEKHPLFRRIKLLEGSSVDRQIVAEIKEIAAGRQKIMVILDSNHTHDHVLQELNHYSPLVSKDSYLVVFDTVIEDMPKGYFTDRPWDVGNNPKTAVQEFLKSSDRFVIDKDVYNKLLISVAPDGYLKCVKE